MGKPNVVLIVCDQMTSLALGVHGHRTSRTPTLDRLAAGGIFFENAYTSYPVCTPARASLMTGRYASNVGVYDNASGFGFDVPTVAHYMTNAGYDTVLSGKMHFIGPDQLHGFEKRLTTDIYPANLAWLPSRDEGAKFRHVDHPDAKPLAIDYVTAGPRQWSEGLDYDEEVHLKALEYLRSRRTQPGGSEQLPKKPRDERPFFLTVSYHHPHEPFHVPRALWDEFRDLEVELPDVTREPLSTMDRWVNQLHGVAEVPLDDEESMRTLQRAYLALVAYIDRKVAEILLTLEDMGHGDDTVIIFTSDHGDMLGERGMVQKRTFYERATKIPMIVAGPGIVADRVVTPVNTVDVLPTILRVAGTAPLRTDGASMIDALPRERVVFSEYHSEGVYAPCFMVRSGRYKLVYIHGHESQLFDIEADPGERADLAGLPEHAATVDRLRAEVFAAFDPDALERGIRERIPEKVVVKEAMTRTRTHWDYDPPQHVHERFWRFD